MELAANIIGIPLLIALFVAAALRDWSWWKLNKSMKGKTVFSVPLAISDIASWKKDWKFLTLTLKTDKLYNSLSKYEGQHVLIMLEDTPISLWPPGNVDTHSIVMGVQDNKAILKLLKKHKVSMSS